MSNCIRLSCAMCLSVTLVATTMAAAPDPIVYYSLDELDALDATVVDESGNGNDGTIVGTIVLSDEGFKLLDKAYEEHDPTLCWLKTHPLLDSICSDPRYTTLLKKMNLDK